MKFLLGIKQEMREMFTAKGEQIPVTVLKSGVCTVTQVRNKTTDGYEAVQLGFGERKRANKPLAGHLKNLAAVRHIKEIRVADGVADIKRGDQFDVSSFVPGEKVMVCGTSKGHGFQGVVKRHGFAGHPATHGHKDQLRMPGSLSAGGLQHVQKGRRMGGRMGNDQVTVANLEIIAVNPEQQEILVKGAVPGARGSLLIVTAKSGVMQARQMAEPAVSVEPTPVAVSETNEPTPVETETNPAV